MKDERRALVTGASGQDGYYLTRFLVAQGRQVLGISRHPPIEGDVIAGDAGRHLTMDIADHQALRALLVNFAPHEIYHLAAYHRSSAAKVDLTEADEEQLYFRYNIEATRALLRSALEVVPKSRVFLAGSCHLFGEAEESPQTERTPVRPNSLYGITKANNLWLGRYYRKTLGLHCATGILYNHESPRRGPGFITGRIARTVGRIARGEELELVIGDMEAQVDWGFAGDFVEAMVRLLNVPTIEDLDDLIIASGALQRVRDFVEVAFAHVGLDWRPYVRQSAGIHRRVAKTVYHGDTTAIRRLGWQPRLTFHQMVRQMVDAVR
jgi:GDPmannose 4,6-dehydratase